MCALVFLLLRRLGILHNELRLSLRTTLLLAITLGIGTQIWPSSRTLFADQSAAFLLTLALYGVIRFGATAAHPGWVVTAMSAAAASVLCKNIFLLACPALVGYAIWTAKNRLRAAGGSAQASRAILIFLSLLPFVILATVQLWHNHLRY